MVVASGIQLKDIPSSQCVITILQIIVFNDNIDFSFLVCRWADTYPYRIIKSFHPAYKDRAIF